MIAWAKHREARRWRLWNRKWGQAVREREERERRSGRTMWPGEERRDSPPR